VRSDMNAWTHAGTYSDALDGVTPVVAFPINVSGRQVCDVVKRGNRNERSRLI
jgi:hypothetical protein